MKKMKKSVKTAVVSTLVISSTAAFAYAAPGILNKKDADTKDKLNLMVEKIDSDTVKVAIDNIQDIPKSIQFSIKLDGAELKDGENSIKDLVKEEVSIRLKNNQYANGSNEILTDYTYNKEENTIDVLITSENSLPKTGNKLEIFELDLTPASTSKLAEGEAPKYKVTPNKKEDYKYVSYNNKEYGDLGVDFKDEFIKMNVAPTLEFNGKYLKVVEGEKFELTADSLGLTMKDEDEEEGLRLEVRNKSNGNKLITEFIENTPGIYELECVAVDKYNEKSEAISIQVNVVADQNVADPTITTNDGQELKDITINAGEIFKPLENVKAVDGKGRPLNVNVSVDKELNLDPDEDTEYTLTYEATDIYGKTVKKEIKLKVLANNAPIIEGVKDHKLRVGDSFDPKEGVKVIDEDKDIELKVESNVNTNIAGTYQVSYSATDSQGKTTRAMSKVVVNPKLSIINRAPEIFAEDRTITVGDEFNALEGVTAKDHEDGGLTHKVVVLKNNVDTKNPGKYTVTYTVEDSKGAKATKTITVTVNPKLEVINSVPEIHAEDKTITVGDTFDPYSGVTATDKEDDDSTLKIVVEENNVNPNKAGVYTVTYSVTDSKGAKAIKTITVTVNPRFSLINSAPKIYGENKTIYTGDKFDDSIALKGITADDKEDGDLTSDIKVIENNVDTTKAGIYTVKYRVTDSKGASTTKEINVIVVQKPESINHIPKIIAEDKTIKLGEKFDPLLGVTAEDYEDKDLTAKIQVVENNVVETKEGKYKVKYSVTDSKGATATKEITVTVKKDTILAESISIDNKSDNKMYVDNVKILTATVDENADIKDVQWTISDESIATLDVVGNKAKVIAKSEGNVTITASTKDGSNKSDSVTIEVINFMNDEEIPSHIKDVIDTNVLLPIAGSGNGEESSPIKFEVKNVTENEVEKLLEGLGDLSPVLKEVREENGFRIYKIKLTKKARLFRSADESYIEIKVSNDLDNADEINNILSQLNGEVEEKPEVGANPTIIIDGLNTIINVGDNFNPLEGVKAFDKDGADITANITISGTVDTSKAGSYELTYTVKDKDGRASSLTTVITVKEKPVIDNNGSESNNDGTETNKPNNDGTETNKPNNVGSGTNKPNNVGSGTNTSNNTPAPSDEVKQQNEDKVEAKNSKPTIKVTSKVSSIMVGDKFNPLEGITAYDEEDGDLTKNISVSGTVDTSKAGEYKLVYSVEDKDGNITTFTRIITVNEEDKAMVESNKETSNIATKVVGVAAVIAAAIALVLTFLKKKK